MYVFKTSSPRSRANPRLVVALVDWVCVGALVGVVCVPIGCLLSLVVR